MNPSTNQHVAKEGLGKVAVASSSATRSASAVRVPPMQDESVVRTNPNSSGSNNKNNSSLLNILNAAISALQDQTERVFRYSLVSPPPLPLSLPGISVDDKLILIKHYPVYLHKCTFKIRGVAWAPLIDLPFPFLIAPTLLLALQARSYATQLFSSAKHFAQLSQSFLHHLSPLGDQISGLRALFTKQNTDAYLAPFLAKETEAGVFPTRKGAKRPRNDLSAANEKEAALLPEKKKQKHLSPFLQKLAENAKQTKRLPIVPPPPKPLQTTPFEATNCEQFQRQLDQERKEREEYQRWEAKRKEAIRSVRIAREKAGFMP